MIDMGINVAIGSDGAACSNRLDIFSEMRLAALIQKIPHGVAALSPEAVFNMATESGAKALGENGGRIEVGANADFVIYKREQTALVTGGTVLSALVYSATPSVVDEVWIGGEQVVSEGEVVGWSTSETVRGVEKSLAKIKGRRS
jgi:5-methylthioadenosine/S-adenosylhomocysteine deaminase